MECGQPLETEKGKETECFLDSPKQEHGRANSLIFLPVETHVGILTYRAVGVTLFCFKLLTVVVMCYNSNRKGMHSVCWDSTCLFKQCIFSGLTF